VDILVIIFGAFFTILSSFILAYVSMATGTGPWVAPSIVLLANLILQIFKNKISSSKRVEKIVLIQTIGSIGGIVATGIGFTLPMLYFLDQNLFFAWLKSPFKFVTFLAFTCIAAGGLGISLARIFSDKLIIKDNLKFPVSHMIDKMINSASHTKQTFKLFFGFFSTIIFCFFRDGFWRIKGFIPHTVYLFQTLLQKEFALTFYLGPTLWAVGFISGSAITLPLIVGIFSKYIILNPINNHSLHIPFTLFTPQPIETFSLAFCCGLVLADATITITKYPFLIWTSIKNSYKKVFSNCTIDKLEFKKLPIISILNLEIILMLGIAFLFFAYFEFPFLAQLFIICLTIIATYQISYMGAKIGLISFGKFATFVMLPTMMLFDLNFMQITIVCMFFNICAAASSDLLFDYKVGNLNNIKFSKIKKYQWSGLIVTALVVGSFFWIIFHNFKIGTPELFTYRAMARSLLVKTASFNFIIISIGFIFGIILKKLKINPTMVLCGILMPNSLSIGLTLGGISAFIMKNIFKKNLEDCYSFWSGIFAGESVWIFLIMLFKLLKI